MNIYRFLKDHIPKLILVVEILIVSLVIVSWLIPPTSRPSYVVTLPTLGTIIPATVFHAPYVEIQVSPPGYPPVGEFWTIHIYVVNKTAQDKLAYSEASNASLIVTLISDGVKKTYELSPNENGVATFQYHSSYTDIAFEAQTPELSPSQKAVLSTHYVSSDVVDTLFTFNIFSILIWLPSGYLIADKIGFSAKWVKLEKLILLFMVFLFIFVFLSALYVKSFRGTIWGYPHNLVNGFITLSLLRDIFYLWVILLVSYSAIKIIVSVIKKPAAKSTSSK